VPQQYCNIWKACAIFLLLSKEGSFSIKHFNTFSLFLKEQQQEEQEEEGKQASKQQTICQLVRFGNSRTQRSFSTRHKVYWKDIT